MRHWLFMFRPDTYATVTAQGVVGIRHEHRRRFAEVRKGDRFVAFVSKKGLLDGHGKIASDPFENDSPIFGTGTDYPHRCKVAFDKTGAAVSVGNHLWELDAWASRTAGIPSHPANMLFCYGGFMEIPASDYEHLVETMEPRPA